MIRALAAALAAAILAVWGSPALARTAADYPVGARAQAMGGAFSAVADDGHALYWNPAGLARLGQQEFTSTLGNLYGAGVADNYLGYVFPFTDFQAMGLSWHQSKDDDAELGFSENTLSFGLARLFGKKLSFGLAGRYLQSTVSLDGSDVTQWSGLTFDAGLHYAHSDRLAAAVTVRDATGRTVSHKDGASEQLADPQLTFGAAYRPLSPWLVALDVNDRLHLGSEYSFRNILAVQAGLEKDLAKRQGAQGEGITPSFGVSARWKFLHLDVARIMPPVLPATNRLTLAATFNLNPSRIRVEKAEMQQVFASQTKRYAEHPVGSIKLTSKTDEPQAATVSVFVPGLMDAPTEKEVVVRPKETRDFPVTAVFANGILALDEDRAAQAQVQVRYRHKNRTRTEKASTQFFVYRPGAILWEDTRAAAAFVTANDPVVSSFARAVVQGRDAAFEGGPLRNLTTAMRLFNALSGHGITYVPDPNGPFAPASATQKNVIDEVQYPRSLLVSRTGDCDDMSVLYCAMLENVGIRTAFLDGPGHILMMFDTGVHARNALSLSVDEDLYAVRGEEVWIPVETTMLGKSFLDAWAEGAAIYRRWERSADFQVVPVQEAWAEYSPSLPDRPAPQVSPPSAESIDRRFAADLDSLRGWQSAFLKQKFLEPLDSGPRTGDATDLERENQLATVHAHEGRFAEARASWARILAAVPSDARALNNLGNLALLEGRADSAAALYERALRVETDPGVILNLGLARWAHGDESGADTSFTRALALLAHPADAEHLLGLPPAPRGLEDAKRLTIEEIRQRLREAARRVPRLDPASAPKAAVERARPARVVSKVSGARASELKSLARIVYWKGPGKGGG